MLGSQAADCASEWEQIYPFRTSRGCAARLKGIPKMLSERWQTTLRPPSETGQGLDSSVTSSTSQVSLLRGHRLSMQRETLPGCW